jgi:DNA-binding NarL/FixJ family response regulator
MKLQVANLKKCGDVKNILIVGDSKLIRSRLRMLIEQQPGWKVCGEAENGREGIAKARSLLPDLIVIDLAMPVLNGIEASRQIKQLMPAVPVVMFTTYADPYLEKEARNAGVDAIVSKSDAGTALLSSIEDLCARNSRTRAD